MFGRLALCKSKFTRVKFNCTKNQLHSTKTLIDGDDHRLRDLSTSKQLQSVESELDRISNWPEYSPVLLTWMLLNYDNGKGPVVASSRSKQFGEKAIKQQVLKVIGDIANDSVIQVFRGAIIFLPWKIIFFKFNFLFLRAIPF